MGLGLAVAIAGAWAVVAALGAAAYLLASPGIGGFWRRFRLGPSRPGATPALRLGYSTYVPP